MIAGLYFLQCGKQYFCVNSNYDCVSGFMIAISITHHNLTYFFVKINNFCMQNLYKNFLYEFYYIRSNYSNTAVIHVNHMKIFLHGNFITKSFVQKIKIIMYHLTCSHKYMQANIASCHPLSSFCTIRHYYFIPCFPSPPASN